jgi:site-specific DNA recombinase
MRKKLPTDGQKLAVVYCRVSTKGQEDGTSLETQAEACIEHAEKLGYTIGRVTTEVFSGAKLWDRTKLAQDRADIKAGKFQALICYAIDRLSRDVAHLAIIMEECERVGCEPIFVTENLDNSAQGKLLRSVQSYVAEVEREKIRERVMRGRKAKLHISSSAPSNGRLQLAQLPLLSVLELGRPSLRIQRVDLFFRRFTPDTD